MTIYQNNLAGTGFLQGATGAPGPAANTNILEYEYIATQGQTTFTGNDKYGNSLSYTANGIFVALNGSLLNELEEYSAINGSSITLNQAASANDELVVYTLPAFNVANTYTQQQANTIFLKLTGGTISGNVNFVNGANLLVPVGNTAQRPAAAQGYIRYNTDLNTLESANATAWANVGSGSASSGGGGVSWTPTVQNTSFISVINSGYFVNTATGNVTVTLPASPTTGSIIAITDYGRTFGTNNLIIYPNGNKLSGNTTNGAIAVSGQSVNLVYSDNNQGWINYSTGQTVGGPYNINYLVVAGGGGGGEGGGGAGGLLASLGQLVYSGTSYSVVVGSGGSGQTTGGVAGSNGGNSSIANIANAVAGGRGGSGGGNGQAGGSGGGGGNNSGTSTGGSGTSGQGYPGGNGLAPANYGAGGGGGAGAAGITGSPSAGGNGGVGLTSSISGASTYYAGGGGGSLYQTGSGGGSTGGTGGGGNGAAATAAGSPATIGTGGGGGGASGPTPTGGNGGSGIVIISYQSAIQKGAGGTVTQSGGNYIHTFTSSGTFTA
jgi:hypothetical protein